MERPFKDLLECFRKAILLGVKFYLIDSLAGVVGVSEEKTLGVVVNGSAGLLGGVEVDEIDFL